MEEISDVSGLLYKRRGGFGKMMPQNWVQRYFVISKEGYLSYYDTDSPDKISLDTKARGKIDLRSASCEFLEDQSATELGEPTPFSIIITPQGEERWKLCASSKDEFEKWTKGLQRLANVIKSDSKAVNDGSFRAIQQHQQQQGSPSTKPVTINKTNGEQKVSINRANKRQTMKLKKTTSHATSDLIELVLTLFIMNLSYHLASESTPPRKYFFVALATVVVGLTLSQRNRRGNDSTQLEEKSADPSKKNTVTDATNIAVLKQRPTPGIYLS